MDDDATSAPWPALARLEEAFARAGVSLDGAQTFRGSTKCRRRTAASKAATMAHDDKKML